MNKRKNAADRLKKSVSEEDKSVHTRFAQAEKLLKPEVAPLIVEPPSFELLKQLGIDNEQMDIWESDPDDDIESKNLLTEGLWGLVEEARDKIKREKKTQQKGEGLGSKVVRDSFTFPETDYGLIQQLRKRLMMLGIEANKSEVLRAGLHALTQASDSEINDFVAGLAKVQTGRPKRKS